MASYADRRRWAREESAARAKLRSLRSAVNTALKRAGYNKARSAQGRVVYATYVAGWETESVIHASTPHVSVMWSGRTHSHDYEGLAQAEAKFWADVLPALETLSRVEVARRDDDSIRVVRVYNWQVV